jgi:curved DNA-binding protein CbpA
MVESEVDPCEVIIRKNNYYDILSVSKDSSTEEIRKAYKKLAIKYHPDKNKSPKAPDAFKKISHAFSVLSDEEKKKNYDRFGHEDGIGMSNDANHGGFYAHDIDPFDLFNQMFGGNFAFNHSNSFSGYQVYTTGDGTRVFTSTSFGGCGNQNTYTNDENNSDDEDNYDSNRRRMNTHAFNSFRMNTSHEDIFTELLFPGMNRRKTNTQRQNIRSGSNSTNSSTRFRNNINDEKLRRQKQRIKTVQLCLQVLPILCILLIFILPFALNYVSSRGSYYAGRR